MCMLLMMLGRQKDTQHKNKYRVQVPLSLSCILKSKSHKSPCIDKLPSELIMVEDRTIRLEIYKQIISILNKEELPKKCKELIVVHLYKKGKNSTYKILSNVLRPHAQEFIGVYQCRIRGNRSTTDHIFSIHQVF
jgi:hypothetical protein